MKKFAYLIFFIIIWLNGCGVPKGSSAQNIPFFTAIFSDDKNQVYFRTNLDLPKEISKYYIETNGTIKKISEKTYEKNKKLYYKEQKISTTKNNIKSYIRSQNKYKGYIDINSFNVYDKTLNIVNNKFLVMLISDIDSQNESHPKKYKLILVTESENGYDSKEIQLPTLEDSSVETRRFFSDDIINIENKPIFSIFKYEEKITSFKQKVLEVYIAFYDSTSDNISIMTLHDYIKQYTTKNIDNIYKYISPGGFTFPQFLISKNSIVIIKTINHGSNKKYIVKYQKIPFDENKENIELDIDY